MEAIEMEEEDLDESNIESNNPAPEISGGGDLPEGWTMEYDDEGVPYYYNPDTKETQWEPPTM